MQCSFRENLERGLGIKLPLPPSAPASSTIDKTRRWNAVFAIHTTCPLRMVRANFRKLCVITSHVSDTITRRVLVIGSNHCRLLARALIVSLALVHIAVNQSLLPSLYSKDDANYLVILSGLISAECLLQ